ncbi:MAG: NAD(P)H-dependent oxidoreductase subunit E [Oligoflexales bacterium]
MSFSPALKEKINGYLTRYETRRSAILPILHAIQDECGWISGEQVQTLDREFDLPEVHVREVLTFYSMYRQQKPAKHTILFCDNIVCCMMGAKPAMEKIKEKVNAVNAQKGEQVLSLQGVPCLGVCDGAPAMLVNKDRYLKVTADNVDQILSKYI